MPFRVVCICKIFWICFLNMLRLEICCKSFVFQERCSVFTKKASYSLRNLCSTTVSFCLTLAPSIESSMTFHTNADSRWKSTEQGNDSIMPPLVVSETDRCRDKLSSALSDKAEWWRKLTGGQRGWTGRRCSSKWWMCGGSVYEILYGRYMTWHGETWKRTCPAPLRSLAAWS